MQRQHFQRALQHLHTRIRSFIQRGTGALVVFFGDLVVSTFHITLEYSQGFRFVRLKYISPFDDTFQKTFHQIRILSDSLPQDHYARVWVLDTKLIETDQFSKAGFAGNEQVRYRHRSRVDYAPFQRLETEIRFAGW